MRHDSDGVETAGGDGGQAPRRRRELTAGSPIFRILTIVTAKAEQRHAIGIGQWFRYVTGAIEVSSAVALLVPSFAVFGALALVATMIGAIAAHLFVVGGSPAMPVILLLGSAGVLWARRNQLLR
jgi:putative oxidoreductase